MFFIKFVIFFFSENFLILNTRGGGGGVGDPTQALANNM